MTLIDDVVLQPMSLALMRCDVMLDAPACIEINPNVPTACPQVKAADSTTELDQLEYEKKLLSVMRCSQPKQVEINTIASSFAGLSVTLQQTHEYVSYESYLSSIIQLLG